MSLTPQKIDEFVEGIFNTFAGSTRSRSNTKKLIPAIEEDFISQLILHCREVVMSQPILLELEAPIKICGDIHAQLADLVRLFTTCGMPPASNYLFLGDYVDRGKYGVETMCLLMSASLSGGGGNESGSEFGVPSSPASDFGMHHSNSTSEFTPMMFDMFRKPAIDSRHTKTQTKLVFTQNASVTASYADILACTSSSSVISNNKNKNTNKNSSSTTIQKENETETQQQQQQQKEETEEEEKVVFDSSSSSEKIKEIENSQQEGQQQQDQEEISTSVETSTSAEEIISEATATEQITNLSTEKVFKVSAADLAQKHLDRLQGLLNHAKIVSVKARRRT